MGDPPPSWVLLRSLRKAGRCGDPGTSIANCRSPTPGAVGWWQGVVLFLLATRNVGVECSESHASSTQWWWAWLEESVFHLLLMVTHGWRMVAHVLIMIASGVVMEAISREGHTSSLVTTEDLLIWLLLIVVKVVNLPLCTWALMPGTLRMMRRRLLPPSMFRLVHMGRSRLIPACMHRMVHQGWFCLIKSYVAGEGRAF